MNYDIEVSRIISTANLLGKVLLMSGAETYRVENSIFVVCKKFGLKAESFVTRTCIITSAKNELGETITEVNRIYTLSNDLSKIDQLNYLIKNIEKYSLDELEQTLKKIQSESFYRDKTMMIAYFFAAAFFSLLFKGDIADFIVAGFGGCLIFYMTKLSDKLKLDNFFINTLGGFAVTIFAAFATKIKIIDTPSYATIGTLMLLVPGLALTNAIRDLINGDLVAGISRTVEAFLTAAALAIGTGFALFLIS